MNQIKNKLIELSGMQKQLSSTISQLESDVATLDLEGVDVQRALLIAQDVAEKTQENLTDKLGGLVSECIKSIFGDEFDFRIEFITKRSQSECKLILIENGVEYDDILNSCGGGVADICSFGLRLACFLIDSRPKRRTILLDECVKNLRFYTKEFYQLIDRLSEELDIQFIVIPSPADEYPESFNRIEIKKLNGRSYVEES